MEVIIVGTEYAGEIKKSAFTVMNYLMPDEGILPMHSAINVGADGDVAVFFGLSGTGKTTLSADPQAEPARRRRARLGRRHHLQFRGRLLRQDDPALADLRARHLRDDPALRHHPGERRRRPADPRARSRLRAITENTRGAYPLEFIGNADPTGIAGTPRAVIFLTADAFGVLPPIARLTRDQAAYHFISGYTAKLAGTEVGLKEPTATFSACFGAPFMPRHPDEYAGMLADRLERDDVPVWLVNTGWTGGPYGTGERMNIAHTRSIVRAALDGSLAGVATRTDPTFGFEVPTTCPDVPVRFLDPRATWADPEAYDRAAATLARMFVRQLRGVRRRRRRGDPGGRPAGRPNLNRVPGGGRWQGLKTR